MKATIITLLIAFLAFLSGCKTPVAIDPQTGAYQTASFQAGFFYAPLQTDMKKAFRVAIAELDDMGYFRTGELHKDTAITIYARKVGDEKVTVRISVPTEEYAQLTGAQSMIRIRIGTLGDLAESQIIYARIRDAL